MMEETQQEIQRSAMELFLFLNNRAGAWATIENGYQVYPFIVLDHAFTIVDSISSQPKLVFFGQLIQSTVSK